MQTNLQILMNLSQKDKSFVWHPFDIYNSENIIIKKGSGVYLHTKDGRKIIDGISSWWVNLHGHRNTKISKAINKQLRYLEHVIFAGFSHEPAIKLAESLCKILPGEMQKIFFSDNGSTSTEVALKMAFQYWYNKNKKKIKVMALQGAYHGDTFGAMSVAERGGFNVPFEPYLFDVVFIPFPDDDLVLDQFEAACKSTDAGVFIYEPLVQGSAGMRIYAPEMLEKLLLIAKKYDVICIADEVMTGFGRTNKLFASEFCQTKPDIICLSKGITGGYFPLGATAVNTRIAERFATKQIDKIFLHGHSYTANPLACAAANASLEILLSSESTQNRLKISENHIAFVEKIKGNPKIKNAKTFGTILALEVKNDTDTSYFNNLREFLYTEFLKRDILLRPLGNVIYVLPPYIISENQLNRIYAAIEEVLGLIE